MIDINKLNLILNCNAMKKQLGILASNPKRLCLNENVVEQIRYFLADIINAFIIFDLQESDICTIHNNFEDFLTCKLKELGVEDKVDAYNFFLNKVNESEIFFHGTSSMFDGTVDFMLLSEKMGAINEIYERHGVYKCFESGIRDVTKNLLWFTNSANSAVFYALQSPEFLARFASRSDYYKQDPYIYDKQAYYRKDFFACKRNIEIETKEFAFSKEETKVVLKVFKQIWNIVVKNGRPVIKLVNFKPINKTKVAKLSKKEIIQKSFAEIFDCVWPKQHFFCDWDYSAFESNDIYLPKISNILKQEKKIENRKYIVVNNEKLYPDFYSLGKLMTKEVFFFDKFNCDNSNVVFIKENIVENGMGILATILNECQPNSERARRFLEEAQKKFWLDDIKKFYKTKFQEDLKELQNCKNDDDRAKVITKISENSALKFVCLEHYERFLKDTNLAFVYTYSSKLLGRNFVKSYKHNERLNQEKLNALIATYKRILRNPKILKKVDFPTNFLDGKEVKL